MIPLEKVVEIKVNCHSCKASSTELKKFFFQGIHLLGDYSCLNCGTQFFQTFPIAHDSLFPIQLTSDLKRAFFSKKAESWLAKPLIDSLREGAGISVTIEVEKRRESEQIVFVNTLDTCFGHIITKLWNAYTLEKSHPQLGLVILVPESCAWMVPDQTAEVWKICHPLKDLGTQLLGLDNLIKEKLEGFKQVYISQVPIHLDYTGMINFEKMFKSPRFDISKFSATPLKITFMLREDRFWLRSKFLQTLHLASVKFRMLMVFRPILVRRQCRLINRLALRIRKEIPSVSFAAVGIGKSASLSRFIQDHRKEKPDTSTEIQWNKLYSQSHLVIGIHGSGMMIPTALAAGFINILPAYKIDHMIEDTLLPYSNRLLHFLGRFVDEGSSPKFICRHVVSIYREFPYVFGNLMQVPE